MVALGLPCGRSSFLEELCLLLRERLGVDEICSEPDSQMCPTKEVPQSRLKKPPSGLQ
jgi:hypothetical protein